MKPHPDHKSYILSIREKDDNIIKKLYGSSLYKQVIAHVKKNRGTHEEGEDIFQEAMTVIIKKAFDQSFILPTSFKAYLFGISRNLWLKKLQEKNKISEVRNSPLNEPNYTSPSDMEEGTWDLLLERTFLQLSDLCRKILSFYRAGKKAEEIAFTLDMEVNTVYRNKNRCGLKWRKFMEADQDFADCKPF